MKSDDRTIVELKNYKPVPYRLESIHLEFDLHPTSTRVRNRMKLAPLPGAEELYLNGQDVTLQSLRLNGLEVPPQQYQVDKNGLHLKTPNEAFDLEIVTVINPKENSELSGLYLSRGMYCTQCEAEGFRRITYSLDRPDVMTRYTTVIRANPRDYPVLLSNGNRVRETLLPDGRAEVTWEDPHPKPTYLFALVAGNLARRTDTFQTRSGRRVALEIYVEHGFEDRVGHAMTSLKKSMRWDEEKYGREYDLDVFMIVAVDDFNSGAMENKGLNIFNSKYILAKPETATDADYAGIESVVAHEYFHNRTGNRITCRDWFQLSLKEGLTVFRDQEFSADMNSRAVKRIDDVSALRTHQFAEDAGPTAHPVRPDSYMEINNFYTLTIYEKGAEVVRMIHTLLGPELFRKGMDRYFELYDGQAVTTDDFVKAMELASGRDLTQFKNWYVQAGTPEVEISENWLPEKGELHVQVRQTCRPTAERSEKDPFVIPLATALFSRRGQQLRDEVLELKERQQEFVFGGFRERPIASYLRGFSAPVRLITPHSEDDLRFLLAFESDPFQKWESLQKLWRVWIFKSLREGRVDTASLAPTLAALRNSLVDQGLDPAGVAQLLVLPTEHSLVPELKDVNPEFLHQVLEALRGELAQRLQPDLARRHGELVMALKGNVQSDVFDGEQAGRRALKNQCLRWLCRTESSFLDVAWQQLDQGQNMTDQFAALQILSTHPDWQEGAADRFIRQWGQDFLVTNKWLTAMALVPSQKTLGRVQAIMKTPYFDIKNPNRVYSLILNLTQFNVMGFHGAGREAYDFLSNHLIELDGLNPQVASRVAKAFAHWRRYAEPWRSLQEAALRRVESHPGLSRNVYEIVHKSLM